MDSLFKIKEMAGKIVPAISSSNALAASLQVFEAVKLLARKDQDLRGIVYQRTFEKSRMNSFKRVCDKPNPDCLVCSDDSQSIIVCTIKEFATATLKDVKEALLGFTDAGLTGQTMVFEFNHNIIYEYDQEMINAKDEDDLAEIRMNEKRLLKTLTDLKIKSQQMVQI